MVLAYSEVNCTVFNILYLQIIIYRRTVGCILLTSMGWETFGCLDVLESISQKLQETWTMMRHCGRCSRNTCEGSPGLILSI